jgi:hypothetical protein
VAIAFYLLEEAAQRLGSVDNALLLERDMAERFLLHGQRQDGFWPYVYPGAMQQFVHRHQGLGEGIRRIPVLRRPFFKSGDESILFGDAVHHCLVLYYLAKASSLREPSSSVRKAINAGWEWICSHVVDANGSGFRFDFDWEPVPSFPRYCNFRDTSTYFLILASLPHLADLAIEGPEYNAFSSGICAHIESALLEQKGSHPAIRAYEGTSEELRFILPRVGEATAWKGALLADIVLRNDRDTERQECP